VTHAAAGEAVVGAPAGWLPAELAASVTRGEAVLAGRAGLGGWAALDDASLPVQPAVTPQAATIAHAAAYVRHRLLARCTPRL
jgi:hypothetical protein